MSGNQPEYIFLDDDIDRKKFLAVVHRTRRSVMDVVAYVPQDQWYEPRYHNWSLAAMLGHLNMMDSLAMFTLKVALLGVRLRVSSGTLNRFNHLSSRLFKGRLIAASLKSLEKNEKRISDFVLHLPVNKFSRQVYVPSGDRFTTVERAIQDFFLHHWREHLETMQIVEGIHTDKA